ncbi:MAG: alpha/beta hydrolase [Akkermansiaceae bacterium]|nr:alpha/beta hydrolase [Verrucomicrobiales bacterium]
MKSILKPWIAAGWLLFMLCGDLRAAECLPVTVRNPDGNYIVPGVKGGIVYRRINGVELSLDAYVQKSRTRTRRPAVVVIHGGSWADGSRAAFIGQFLELLTRAGYNWFAVDYRLGGLKQYREAVDDLRAAVDFIRCHAHDFQVDPDNIALLGEDAGAHLALMLAAERPAGVKAVVSIGGFYDLREVPNLKSQISNDFLAQASPITTSLSAMPPTLIVHGTNDREVPLQQAGQFYEAMRAAGGSCEYIAVDGAIHRAENWLPAQWGYKGLVAAWLAKEFGWAGADHKLYVTGLRKDLIYDPRHNLKLDAYVPAGRGPHPAVIIAHGGGWEAGDKVTYITPLFEPLAKAGFAWFSVDYRLTPHVKHQEQLADLRTAINYIRRNAASFRVDPHRIALLGESASGQMVAKLATENPTGIKAVVSFYGVYDFFQMDLNPSPRSLPARLFGFAKLDEEERSVIRQHSPIYHVNDRMPPLLLIHGTNERLYAQGVAMAKKLAEAGANYDFIEVQNAPHGIENWEGHAEWVSYKQQLVDWLKRKLTRQK